MLEVKVETFRAHMNPKWPASRSLLDQPDSRSPQSSLTPAAPPAQDCN
jgi:hypothetical protein